jgi:co-chaperonin GroES (HSP10)
LTMTYENAMAEAFPAVDAGIQPFGSRVLIQIRTPKKKSAGGIILDIAGTNDTEKWNTQIGKVVALGPLAFKNRNDMKTWPEGEWCTAGEYVRVAKYGGDRWEVKIPGTDDSAMFVIFNDLDIIGQVTGDPLAIRAFI